MVEDSTVTSALIRRFEAEGSMNLDKAVMVAKSFDPNMTRGMVYRTLDDLKASGQVSQSGCVLTYTGT
jgi:hypothetical protein